MSENQKKVTNEYRDAYDRIFSGGQPSAVGEKAAVGTRGFIMRSDDSYFFRVYGKKGDFVDYDIMHYDLEVQIIDESAALIEHNGNNYIDYSAKVLGYSNV